MAGTTDVTAEDQQKINIFNKRFQRLKEIEAELEGKRNFRPDRETDITVLQKLGADCEDASSELMLVDEEQVRYVLGECFIHATPEEAEEKLQLSLEEVQQEQQRLEQESSQVKAEMDQLKKVLYGKFGNSINLEE